MFIGRKFSSRQRSGILFVSNYILVVYDFAEGVGEALVGHDLFEGEVEAVDPVFENGRRGWLLWSIFSTSRAGYPRVGK